MADYPGATDHNVPPSFMFDSNAHAAIVLHKTGGDATPDAIYRTFLASGKSVHYSVGTDGSIWQYVPEALGAGGNCCVEDGYDPFWTQFNPMHVGSSDGTNLNTVTISIEHCDASLDNSTPLTPAQQEASFKLVAYLVQKYNIPLTHIKGHNSIDPVDKAHCPGNYPWQALFAFLQNGGTTMGVPAGWKDDGTTLTAPNGMPVVRGFREYILSNPWDSSNIPLVAEHGMTLLEVGNPSIGAGTSRAFRMTVLEWTPDRGVFEMWVDQEILALR
jgi:N-acetylmuramoyl-L-alanine amidase